ncbi:MAG: hypothetical protein BWY11_02086 [Firmicutes bacterium ADurb.Bin182]|nr:MAG: hypothetical protein BWY11_02086 [Firmicutes bacterium ADurb.Bin182]
MFTAFYSIGRVIGFAEIWLYGIFICLLVFTAICLLFKANRTKKGIIIILLSLLAAEIICDVIWFLIYFSDGSYYNYGLKGVFGLLLWPAMLILAGVISTKLNITRSKMN